MLGRIRQLMNRNAAAPTGPPRTTRPALNTAHLVGGHETILVAEDETAMLEYIRAALELLGYKVFTAGDGEEALRLLQQHPRQKIDLLLTDLVMPRMGGKELAYRAQPLIPDYRVLFCSAYPGPLATRNGMFPRHVLFLQKPVTVEKLAETVRWVLDAAQELHGENAPDPEGRPSSPHDLRVA